MRQLDTGVAGRPDSELTRPVNVGAVLDSHNDCDTAVIIKSVDHSVVASPGAAQSLQVELEFLPTL